MKILLTADAVGGVWQYATDLARGLSELGVETVLAVLGPSPTKAQLKAAATIRGLTLVDTGLPLDWLAADAGTVRAGGERMAELAEAHAADLIQLNAPALAAEVRFERPVVAVSHSCVASWWEAVKGSPLESEFGWRADLTAQGLRNADCVVTPTAAFGAATMRVNGLAALPRTVHNGRAPLPLPRVAPHDFALTAGRLWDKAKNVPTLEAAAARLNIPFYGAGSVVGPSGDTIELDAIRALGSLGERELGRWLAARPVFVSSAVYEPFGLAVLEAAAAGCPLVLSDIPAFRELWDGAATFVDAMDAAGFAAAMARIVGDDTLRAELGAAAKARAARYTPQAMAAEMAAIYKGLVAPPAAAGVARVAA